MAKQTRMAVTVFNAALIRLLVVGAVGDDYTSELATARTLAAVTDPQRDARLCANVSQDLRLKSSSTTLPAGFGDKANHSQKKKAAS